jgi:DNA-binding transcriptional ArsR family regulator
LIGKQSLAYHGRVGDLFKALADSTRRRILDELAERDEQTLFEICSRLAVKHGLASSRQAVSQHLDVLEAAGLVGSRRQGRYKYHALDPAPLARIADRWTGRKTRGESMRIALTSVYVDDQDQALEFYTGVLGFVKKEEVPLGEHRWLTVVAPGDPDGVELVLEPAGHPAVGPYRQALAADGIPATSFAVPDVQQEYDRLTGLGVAFTQAPVEFGPVTTAVFDDTCGNLIQIAQRR